MSRSVLPYSGMLGLDERLEPRRVGLAVGVQPIPADM
jgi:hypothetical protein